MKQKITEIINMIDSLADRDLICTKDAYDDVVTGLLIDPSELVELQDKVEALLKEMK